VFADEISVLSDTKRKTSVPSFFASTGGLRLPLFQTYTAENLYIFSKPKPYFPATLRMPKTAYRVQKPPPAGPSLDNLIPSHYLFEEKVSFFLHIKAHGLIFAPSLNI